MKELINLFLCLLRRWNKLTNLISISHHTNLISATILTILCSDSEQFSGDLVTAIPDVQVALGKNLEFILLASDGLRLH